MKKSTTNYKVNDGATANKSSSDVNTTVDVSRVAETNSDADVSKFEFDAQMDLETEIMNELNEDRQAESPHDTDSESDPYCGL